MGLMVDVARKRRMATILITDDLGLAVEYCERLVVMHAGHEAVMQLAAMGGQAVKIDFSPFSETGQLLYEGPWVVERLAAIEDFVAESGHAMHPITRQIIAGGAAYSAVETFRAFYCLERLWAETRPVWDQIDCLVVPTAPTIYRLDAVEAEPIHLNAQLGMYTNFVNLLDLSAIAVPAGFRPPGIPMGITFIAPAFHDERLLDLAWEFHRRARSAARRHLPSA